MIGLLQRVREASVSLEAQCIARIEAGLLVLVGIKQQDTAEQARWLAQRLLDYRVFADSRGRMNRSLRDVDGGLLLVPQFTLCADTRRGLRPGFEKAAPPQQAEALFESLCREAERLHPSRVAAGRFGADMQVALVNDGPVTFWLER
jgi:D-tyrosyl-tRNA(Tyr) deacylase